MRIAIAGATGTVGRLLVRQAQARGLDVVALSRSCGVDVLAGDGLRERLAGVDVIIDALNTPAQRRSAAESFFRRTTGNLLAAGAAAGVGHHVLLSIIGVDRVDSGYYLGKRAQEAAVRDGAVPWSILRASQFHEFAEQALGFVRFGPVSLVPQMRIQPVAAREVASALLDLAQSGPAAAVPELALTELAGPEEHELVALARRVNGTRSLGRKIMPLRVPGAAGRAMRAGALLPTGPGPRGVLTFDQWLSEIDGGAVG